MEIPPLHRAVRASELPLDRLAANPNVPEKEKVAELSRQFEALLLRQVLKDIRKTVIPSDLLPESLASNIYQDMVTQQLADAMSKSGTLGLARSLEKDLSRQLKDTTLSPTAERREH
jgi:peptidoglycan hydrolase FlgJ